MSEFYLDQLKVHSDEPVAAAIKRNFAASVYGKISSVGESSEPDLDGSRIGGCPSLQSDFPTDRNGKPLLFIAQVNFAELPDSDFPLIPGCGSSSAPKTGLLSIFWNQRKDSSNPKDRHSFRILWSEASEHKSDSTKSASTERASTERASIERASIERASTERASTERASTERASIERASIERASIERASTGSADFQSASEKLSSLRQNAHNQSSHQQDSPQLCAPLKLSFSSEWSLPPDPSQWLDSESVNRADLQRAIDLSQAVAENSVCQLFGYGNANIEKLKQIAAFASNGVSWSPARSADSCYSHLVDAAQDWIFLLRLNSSGQSKFDFASTKSITLLIHRDDAISNRFDKAWMTFD